MHYWLMKSEPEVFSVDDLACRPHQTDRWEGVRNYQARNMIRDQMRIGDLAFFYHSSCNEPGIVGVMQIVKAGYPDLTAFDSTSKYYDPTSNSQQPRWYMVDVCLIRKLKRVIGLHELREHPALIDMFILRKGNRLSITPVTEKEWQYILELE